MRLALPIRGYAAAGDGCEALPAARVVPLPEPAGARGGGRLPRLALELAQHALGGRKAPPATGVLLGTALGSLSETEAFVAHMLREHEATPKPRAFSASVHNAAAAFVALKLGAHGPCTTFVQEELSLAHALLAAAHAFRGEAQFLVGAADEAPVLTFAELARAAGGPPGGEGGALFVTGGAGDAAGPALAWLEELALARTTDPRAWARTVLGGAGAEALLVCTAPGAAAERERAGDPRIVPVAAHHPSGLATAAAVALALLAGEVRPPAFGLAGRPRRLAVLATSAGGAAALLSFRQG